MTKTETIQTHRGEVNVEVEKCSSCGNKYRKDNLTPYYTGNLKYEKAFKNKRAVNFEKGTVSRGYICDHCDDSPIGTPSYNLKRVFGAFLSSDPMGAILVGLFIITLIVMIVGI